MDKQELRKGKSFNHFIKYVTIRACPHSVMDSASASGAERAGSNPAEGTILQVKSESSFFVIDKTVTYRNIRRRPACAILKRE